MRHSAIAAACAMFASSVSAFAADAPQTRPAGDAQNLTARVTQVRGIVAVRDGDEQAWRKAEVGMSVPVGGEVRTGPHSGIVLELPEQRIVLDRLGTIRILEALKGDEGLKTQIGMKYGRMRYDVQAAGTEHEAMIRSPSNALAIRGTITQITDDALGSSTVVYEGYGTYETADGHVVTLGRGATDNYGDSPYVMLLGSEWPVDYWFMQANSPFWDSAGLSDEERLVLSSNYQDTGMGTGLSQTVRAYGWSSPARPLVNPVTPETNGTGDLSFNLNWVGDGSSELGNPDLNLFVLSPRGEVLDAINAPLSVPSGGRINRNDKGGAGSTLGVETAAWAGKFPLGTYTYGVRYQGTGDPATYKVLVLLNGRQINADFDDTVTEDDREVSFSIDIREAQQPGAGKAGKAGKVKKPAKTAAPSARPVQRPARLSTKR